ncbi:hypothetical protein R6Q59_011260 [Mikania micrantha]|uniref:Uncharacterized protein n=1 Tax=Mikania micrantha TaxID=192012 RepID=A0A5N6N5N6_9ASTR|nr:hypothetical protein E3N88_24769 [Mikania micrantha]
MEDPESEWRIQEYTCSKEIKWMLSKGYVIVKKVAVTGIVISSAPLVVPPLVVFSALGVAFSVPFGLIFAAYACTNKLMTILLPTPPSPPPLMLESDHESLGLGDDYRLVEEDEDAIEDMKQRVDINVFELDDGCSHEKEVDFQKLLDDQMMILSKKNDENEIQEVDVVARQVMIGDANKEDDDDERNIEQTPSQSMGTHEVTKDASDQDAILKTIDQHLINSNADSSVIGDDKTGLNSRSNSKINVEVGNEMKEIPALKPAQLDTDNAKDASKTLKKMPFREDNLDEEKMWEKMRSIRTIVGYKEPIRPTCIGELKALYVFTGVEPPASFKDDSDLDEVNAKLKFLMSIVGVK